jgi:SAM-dependent methyltransferase
MGEPLGLNTSGILPTPSIFDELSKYWAEIAWENNTEMQVTFVKMTLKPDGLVLDLNCGSGRHATMLGKAGYYVVGLDISRQLLRIAKRSTIDVSFCTDFVLADMQHIPFCSDSFSSTVSLDSSFGYLPSEKEDSMSLREIARTLRKKGIFIIDVFNGDHIIRVHGKSSFNFWKILVHFFKGFRGPRLIFKWREYQSFHFFQKRTASKTNEIMRDIWVFKDKKTNRVRIATHVVRLYNFPKLNTLVEEAGMRTIAAFGEYQGIEYKENSKRLILVAQKTAE